MSDPKVDSQIRALKTELRNMKYSGRWNQELLQNGDPSIYLPITHFLILEYNQNLVSKIAEKGYAMQTATDQEFVTNSMKILKEECNFSTKLSVINFFKPKFALQKTEFLLNAAKAVRSYGTKF